MITVNKKTIREFILAMCHPNEEIDIRNNSVSAKVYRKDGTVIHIPLFKIKAKTKAEFLSEIEAQASDLWDYVEKNG